MDTKSRSMRESLIFTNIDDIFSIREGNSFEDTESAFCDFLQKEIDISDVNLTGFIDFARIRGSLSAL